MSGVGNGKKMVEAERRGPSSREVKVKDREGGGWRVEGSCTCRRTWQLPSNALRTSAQPASRIPSHQPATITFSTKAESIDTKLRFLWQDAAATISQKGRSQEPRAKSKEQRARLQAYRLSSHEPAGQSVSIPSSQLRAQEIIVVIRRSSFVIPHRPRPRLSSSSHRHPPAG